MSSLKTVDTTALVLIRAVQFTKFFIQLEEDYDNGLYIGTGSKEFVCRVLEAYNESIYMLKLFRDELAMALNLEDERYSHQDDLWDLEQLQEKLGETGLRQDSSSPHPSRPPPAPGAYPQLQR